MSERYSQYLEEIRQKVSIVDLVSADGCKLRRKGRAMAGLSPFRQEKDPSFYVYPDQNSWFDFGEELGGDIFAYVMRRDGCDFKAASSKLGEFGNVERYWENSAFAEKDKFMAEVLNRTEMFSVYNLLTEAADWYAHGLPDHARKIYNDNYGLTNETIERLKFGWGAIGLWEYFRETQHYSEEMCLKTGLFIVTGEGVKDFFANRLVMPYMVGGQVRYMIGRRVEGFTADNEHEKGKYKKLLTRTGKRTYVSLHVSNDVFFNEDVVKHGMAELGITEGITDCAAFDQHGFACVSPVTTTFKEASKARLLRLLEKAGKRCKIIICNDNDVLDDGKKPGERGAIATGAFVFSQGFHNVYIATVPRAAGTNKVDSCDYLRTDGQAGMRKVWDEAKKYLEYLIDLVPETLEPEQLGAHLEPIIEAVATLEPITRAAHVDRIAKRFKLPKAAILERMGLVPDVEIPPPPPVPGEEEVPPSKKKRAQIDGDGRIRGQVFEEIGAEGGFYMTRAKDGAMEQISSFVLTPKRRLIFEDQELVQCDISATTGRSMRDYVFQRRAWTSARAFKECFPIADMQWTGGDDHVQGVLSLLNDVSVPMRAGTKNVGYYDNGGAESDRLWIWPGHVMNRHGVMVDPPVSFLPQGGVASDFASRLRYDLPSETETAELASKVYPLLVRVNDPAIIMLLIGWFFSTPFKPRIHRRTGQFPILYVWGTGGSGKSTIVRLFWKLFGMSTTEPYSADDTRLPLLAKLSSTNSVPIFFDELKKKDTRSDRYNAFMKLLREIYVGKTEERGRSDLSVVSYNMSAPVIVAGESVPDEDLAVMERLVCVSPMKSTIDDDSTGAKAAFRTLQKLPFGKLAGPYMRWTLSQEVEPALERASAISDRLLSKVGHSAPSARVADTATLVAFGLLQFDAWCKHLGVRVPDLDPEVAFASLTGQIMRGEGSSVKDAFDFFLEQVSTYVHMGLLHEGRDFVLVDDRRPVELRSGDCPHLLRLHLPSCYEVYLVERKRTGRDDETNGLRALQRLAKEKSMRKGAYITDPSIRTDLRSPNLAHLTGRNERAQVRCVEVDQDAVPGALDFRRLTPSTILHRKAEARYEPPN